ncbi:Histone-lysine N-methyltransferase, H3 lysine-4 specific [Gracilariopsis chorda]|uniref:[histone H3]-lysine(4) N-trimethyltransferase n=1 Tax=Gracilariopsis chorda TaxID=448386 RepID=A0A2V3JE65_9FLOR|nr:Histone-lysine N-methyltransferase, H3 lysine-4 specific [Gracilariopsis chorda]|eukprot:PXF50180.1 Histone-lysine N-methyltransferase, H3 lysine-4 specific [Gracilariopsis chorda]
MLSTGTNFRDPRLAGRDPTRVRDEMRRDAARPLKRLHWARSHPSSHAPFNFLLITNLNDNVSVPLLTSELSDIGTVRHVNIPIVNGRSAGIASVRLPSVAKPQPFVSKFNGYSLFGKQLCVKPDRHATQFASLLHHLNNPKSSNDDSTPPTKDTQADSNSPNLSIASQSDRDVPPPPPPVPPKRNSFHAKSPIGKRPRQHPEPNFLTRNGATPANYFKHPDSATRNDSRRQFSNRTPSRHHSHQHFTPSGPRREQYYGHDPRANPPRLDPHSRKPMPHETSLDRFSRHRRHELHSPHSLHRHRDHPRNRYHRYDDETPPHRFRHRGLHPSPERRYNDVYRDRRGHTTPERRPTQSMNDRSLRSTERATRQEYNRYPPVNSSVNPFRRPAIVLNGAPSSITPAEILSRFRDFRPERILRGSKPGVLTLVFSRLTDREDALRDGCFIMKGKHVSPDPILTAVDGTSPYSARVSSSPCKPDSDRQRALPHRTPQRSTYDSKREPDSERHRHSLARGERSSQASRSPFLGNGHASAEGSRFRRKLKAPRSLDERGPSGSHDKTAQSRRKQLEDDSTPRVAECEVIPDSRIVPEASHGRSEKDQENGWFRTPKPPRSAETPFHDASEEKSSTSRLTRESREAEVVPQLVEKIANSTPPKPREEDENSVNVSKRKAMNEDELFEEVFRHAVDSVSKQHSELEVKRCGALVAKPVFDFISLRKQEEKKRAAEVKTKAVLDAVQRFPSSADAFKKQHFLKVDRSTKDSGTTVPNDSKLEQDSESPRKRRRTRFSDAASEKKKDVPECAVFQSTDLSVDNHYSVSTGKRKVICSNDDSSRKNFETASRDLPPANANGSERSSSTASKVSSDSSKQGKREERDSKLDSDVVMDESIDTNGHITDAPGDQQDSSEEIKQGIQEDTSAEEQTSHEKGAGSNVTHESTKTSSTFARKSEVNPSKPAIQSALSRLDKELERNVPIRGMRSSSLSVVQTDSVVPALKLRLPFPTVLAPKTSHEKEAKRNAGAEDKQRSKLKKSAASTRKASRKLSKSSKAKKKTRAGKSLMNKADKKAKSVASSTSISSGDGPEVSSSVASNLNQTVLCADESKKPKSLTSDGVIPTDLEQQKDKCGHDGVQGENSVDFNDDGDESTCARTFIYRRDQNRNRSRKKLRLDNFAGKSVRSSRQCRQETRLYKKGISQIKPKNDDFINLNSLQQRWKKVQFDRSQIHGMGLYANEHIETDEFVIEYIGDLVRRTVADLREKEYTRQGMGDSYLFRLDSEMVVDATRRGGIARFINHSCNPNLIARTISVDGRSTIAFYSKRTINVGEELTYDYKFDYEAEDKKIPCLCNAFNCRKYLN